MSNWKHMRIIGSNTLVLHCAALLLFVLQQKNKQNIFYKD